MAIDATGLAYAPWEYREPMGLEPDPRLRFPHAWQGHRFVGFGFGGFGGVAAAVAAPVAATAGPGGAGALAEGTPGHGAPGPASGYAAAQAASAAGPSGGEGPAGGESGGTITFGIGTIAPPPLLIGGFQSFPGFVETPAFRVAVQPAGTAPAVVAGQAGAVVVAGRSPIAGPTPQPATTPVASLRGPGPQFALPPTPIPTPTFPGPQPTVPHVEGTCTTCGNLRAQRDTVTKLLKQEQAEEQGQTEQRQQQKIEQLQQQETQPLSSRDLNQEIQDKLQLLDQINAELSAQTGQAQPVPAGQTVPTVVTPQPAPHTAPRPAPQPIQPAIRQPQPIQPQPVNFCITCETLADALKYQSGQGSSNCYLVESEV